MDLGLWCLLAVGGGDGLGMHISKIKRGGSSGEDVFVIVFL